MIGNPLLDDWEDRMLFRDRDMPRSVRVDAGERPSRGRGPVLLAVVLALSLLRPGPQAGMAQDDDIATDQGPIYLPFVAFPTPTPPPADTGRVRQVTKVDGRPEAIAIAGHLLYLGVGSKVETFDISVPGQARPLGSSALVEGRIVRLALGSDRLFALSRPLIDWTAPLPPRLEMPPWTLLSVFDITDPTSPRLLGETTPIVGMSENGTRVNLFATDLAAHERTVYLTVVDRQSEWFAGIVIIDAQAVPVRYAIHKDLVDSGHRLLVLNGRLYIKGMLPPARVTEDRFFAGVMGFDLTQPLEPRWLGVAGHQSVDNDALKFGLVGHGQLLFHMTDNGLLLPIEILEDGRPLLLGEWLNHQPPLSLKLKRDLNGLIRTAAAPSRLYLLQPRQGDTPIASIDVSDPLHPKLLPSFGVGLDLQAGEKEMSERGMAPDLGSDLAATDDGRLFLASGNDGVLVELDVRDLAAEHQVARRSAGPKLHLAP